MAGAGERTPGHEATVTVAAGQAEPADRFWSFARTGSVKVVHGTKIEP